RRRTAGVSRRNRRIHGGRPEVGAPPVEEDVGEELQSHLEMATEDLVARGWTPEAAWEEALRRFGDVEAARAATESEVRSRDRALTRAYRWEAVMQDVKYALRSLARSPGFAVVAILTLALGVGANSAIFSVLNGVLLRPLPYPEPDAILWLDEAHDGPNGRPGPVPWTNFLDWREQSRSFEAMAAFRASGTTVLGGDQPVRATVAAVSRDFWRVFPVQPVLGRLTVPDDHGPGRGPAILVSETFWENELGADPDVLGRTLEVYGVPATIVGVVPGAFDFPFGADLWSPLEYNEQSTSRTAHNHRVAGRLRPGVDVATADAELDRIALSLGEGLPDADYDAEGAVVTPLQSRLTASARTPIFLLMGAAALVLLVACSNLASTLLARGSTRRRELAVRSALGASRGRVVRQLFTESLVLASIGSVVGLAIAWIGLPVLVGLAPDLPRVDEVGLSLPVLLFTGGVAVVTALLFGLFPALRLADEDLASGIRAGDRGNAAESRSLVWRGLVGAEMALALLLLVGGGLLLRSFTRVLAVEPGFREEGVVTLQFQLTPGRYQDLDAYARFYEEFVGSAGADPSVEQIALATGAPLINCCPVGWIQKDYVVEQPWVGPGLYMAVTPDYFSVLDIPLVAGRDFTDQDRAGSPHVAIVSEAFAEILWPDENPLGKVISGGGMDSYWSNDEPVWAEVVGVVADARYRSLVDEVQPAYYFPLYQRPARSRFGATGLVRPADGADAAAVRVVRNLMAQRDPDVPLEISSMQATVSESVSDRRFVLVILAVFSVVALLLAAVGIYGVVSYHVARRTREMGIRLALGAPPSRVRKSVMRGAMITVATGLMVGVGAALVAGRWLESVLFGVRANDPVTLGVVLLTLMSTAFLAAFIPARRSTRIDPMITMRAE
ncbi:MAG: ABC transporter permease, partial [Gemmatimonadota bacterium]